MPRGPGRWVGVGGVGLRLLSPQPPVRPEIVPLSPVFQPAQCLEVTLGDAPKPTGVRMAGILKWEMWKNWFGGMGALRAQVSSVTQLCLILCIPRDCSTPGFLVYHQLPELAQTHVH